MQPIKRAIVLLDQASGALREDGGQVLGVDLREDTRRACGACATSGVEVMLAVPGLAGASFASALDDFAEGFRIVPVGPLTYSGAGALAEVARLAPESQATALVSADRRLRGEARAAGLVPAPHPALLPMLADGVEPQAARVAGPRGALDRLLAAGAAVPMQLQPAAGSGDWAVIGLFAPETLIDAVLARLAVQPLPYDPLTDDLVWARIDAPDDEARAALRGRRILYAEPGQVLIALAPGEDAQALHVHGAHGHAELLVPDPGLLRPAARIEAAGLELRRGADLPPEMFEPVPRDPLDRRLLAVARPSCATVTTHYAADLDRYTGASPLDAAGSIVSRHSAHPDNKRAEAALLADLSAMGYAPWRHDFVHAGATHANILADLPGTGTLRLRPEVQERQRRLLREPVLPTSVPPSALDRLMPADLDARRAADMPRPALRRELERAAQLAPWSPWWKRELPLAGIGAGLIIVGAHLDSTAGFEPGYVPWRDQAPGRDDNASGLAGVLALARHFRALQGQLTHTLRFCFFNAEESGLVGSKAYASYLKAVGAPIRAVFCMDMIGFNSDQNRLFEIHAGYTDPAIRDLSLPLADRVAGAAADYGTLAPAQIYRGTSQSGGPDRDAFDGAINRSDHAAFHQQGYGAVLVSEDFFINLPGEAGADPNPNYHRATDQVTDNAYACDIACAVARAVTEVAL